MHTDFTYITSLNKIFSSNGILILLDYNPAHPVPKILLDLEAINLATLPIVLSFGYLINLYKSRVTRWEAKFTYVQY